MMMRGVMLATWVLWALLGVSVSGALSPTQTDAPAVLSVPFTHGHRSGSGGRRSLKRDKWLNVDSTIESATWFHANVLVGTPGQNATVSFSTWDNECWMHGANSTGCELYVDHELCGGYGGYNVTRSSTAHWVSGGLSVDNGTTWGDFVNDTIILQGAGIDSMKLGVAYGGITSNTLGLGYGESTNSTSISFTQALTNAGIINTPAFSMWMAEYQIYEWTDRVEGKGTILFGGVDKSRYVKPLYTLPVVPGAPGLRKAFRVNMTDITLNGTSVFSGFPTVDAVIDNDLPSVHLPEAMAKTIYGKVGATENVTWDELKIPCVAGFNTMLEFGFGGGAKFKFNLADFMNSQRVMVNKDGQEICDFYVKVNRDLQYEGTVVLGSYFLKRLYTVFDMENDEVSFAYRNWGHDQYSSSAEDDDIVEITSGGEIPGATKSIGVRVEAFHLLGVLATFALLCFNI